MFCKFASGILHNGSNKHQPLLHVEVLFLCNVMMLLKWPASMHASIDIKDDESWLNVTIMILYLLRWIVILIFSAR